MPNIDIIKLVIIVVLLAVVLSLLGDLLGLDIGASWGRMAWDHLNQKPQIVNGPVGTWSPMSVATDLIPSLLWGNVSIVTPIAAIFGAAFIAALVVLIIKVIIRVLGA